MGNTLFALVWVLNFAISVWNAYAVGKVWVEARRPGGGPLRRGRHQRRGPQVGGRPTLPGHRAGRQAGTARPGPDRQGQGGHLPTGEFSFFNSCPRKHPLTVRQSGTRFFLGCENYPACEYTEPLSILVGM